MTHQPIPAPPALETALPFTPPPSPAAAPPPPLSPDRAHWTPARQRIFLAALLDGGSVARAARAAGMSRSSAHRLRARLAGTPFDNLWDQAFALHARRLANPFAPDPAAPAPPPRSVETPGSARTPSTAQARA